MLLTLTKLPDNCCLSISLTNIKAVLQRNYNGYLLLLFIILYPAGTRRSTFKQRYCNARTLYRHWNSVFVSPHIFTRFDTKQVFTSNGNFQQFSKKYISFNIYNQSAKLFINNLCGKLQRNFAASFLPCSLKLDRLRAKRIPNHILWYSLTVDW